MIRNRKNSIFTPLIFFIIVFSLSSDNSISCEPEKYPPPPEIVWPLNDAVSVPLDTGIIVKDFKSPSNNPPELDIELVDSAGNKVQFSTERFQSRRSVYNYEAGLIFIKPEQNLKTSETYALTVKASEGFAEPIDQKIQFSTGDKGSFVTAPENIDVSYYFSEPGYYLSNCQTSTWDKATTLVFMNSHIDGYPVLLVLESNLLKDVSLFHSSMEKRNLAISFLPNEKGLKQCFNLSAYSVSGEKFYSEKLCKPNKCIKGKYLTKERAEEEYKEHGAFGFSMIEFPNPEKELPNYCTLYPPLCKEYWVSIPENNCNELN